MIALLYVISVILGYLLIGSCIGGIEAGQLKAKRAVKELSNDDYNSVGWAIFFWPLYILVHLFLFPFLLSEHLSKAVVLKQIKKKELENKIRIEEESAYNDLEEELTNKKEMLK